MAFSLSPSIEVIEKNATFNIATLPSSLTGMVITSDYGPAYEVMHVPSQWDLENTFGNPTRYNFRDWYNAWNFQQYAASLYAVRPLDQARVTENVAMALSGGSSSAVLSTYQCFGQADMYNESVAEQTLPDLVIDTKTLALSGAVSGGTTTAYAFAWLSMMGAEQLTQDTTDGDIINLGTSEIFQITGTSAAYILDVIGDIPTGWTHAGIVNVASGGTDFVEGELVTQTGVSPASGTIGNGSTDTDVVIVDITGGAFEDTTDLVSTSTSMASASLLHSSSFSLGTTDIISGTLDDNRLIFYNRWATSTQDLGVAVCSTELAWEEVVSTDIANTFQSYFEYTPAWDNDEFFVIVFQWDGIEWVMLETHMCSYTSTARHPVTNRAIYGETWFMNNSSYVYCKVSGDTAGGTADVNTAFGELPAFRHISNDTIYPNDAVVFPGGAYDGIFVQGDVDEAFEMFNDPDAIDINILLCQELSMAKASTVALNRKDCMAIITPFDASELVGKSSANATTYLTENFGTSGSGTSPVWADWNTYSAVYGNMKYQYDKYNDMNRWMSIAGDVAGLYAETDKNHDPWWAPAGILRGKMKNTIKVAYNPTKASRDILYFNAINPVMSVLGEGMGIILGQKTATATASAFDRVNVRRLLITIEKAISTSLRPYLFQFNDEGTRSAIKGLINPYLGRIKARRGLFDFKVVCDETNNTSDIIDANGLIVDVFVQPTKVAEFIQVNVIVTRTGASFDEIAV